MAKAGYNFRALCVLLLGMGLARLARAEPPLRCVVCQQIIHGRFLWFNGPTFRERQPVCDSCSRLDTLCFDCGLPVKENFRKLDDGRLLCDRDAQAAVFSLDEARGIFEEARRDLLRMFSGLGVSPDQNISVRLVNKIELDAVNKTSRSFHDKNLTTGLTHTRKTGSVFEHTIYLLNGLGRSRLAAISAHEYTHTWLHENVASDRQVDGDTIEAFCELVAYKLMSQRNEELEKKVILANGYTRGQIMTLVKADEYFQFHRVSEWMKAGAEDKLFISNTVRLLALNESPPAEFRWQPLAKTPVPATLTLRGISSARHHRFALVNDRTLEKNELARVRVGASNVVVRCLDISDNSVVLQVKGSVDETRLFLRTN